MHFDPKGAKGNASSRHAAGRGVVNPASHTGARALQAILTLDRLTAFTCLRRNGEGQPIVLHRQRYRSQRTTRDLVDLLGQAIDIVAANRRQRLHKAMIFEVSECVGDVAVGT